ncbi:hypothetical protein J6R97_04245 [bacterium]|nr:hypothetical protein [bacterium]
MYELDKPYTDKQRLDFIVQYSHNKGLRIEETSKAIYALEAWEILDNDNIIDNKDNYDIEQEKKELERIGKLKVSKREVFLGLYQAKGITPEEIKALISDPQDLIEFEYASDYYRGNSLIDKIGALIGLKPCELDYFFEYKKFPDLKTIQEVGNA